MTDYISGNWTVSDNITDTLPNPKTISIPDLAYDTDYEVIKSSPNEVVLYNVTSSNLKVYEAIKYARSQVTNAYQTTELGGLNKPDDKSGVRVYVGVDLVVTAKDSVTGVTKDILTRAWEIFQVPNHDCVTEALIAEMRKRLYAASCATGQNGVSRLVEMLKGVIKPQNA